MMDTIKRHPFYNIPEDDSAQYKNYFHINKDEPFLSNEYTVDVLKRIKIFSISPGLKILITMLTPITTILTRI